MTTDTIPKWQRVTGWVLSGILALVFLPILIQFIFEKRPPPSLPKMER